MDNERRQWLLGSLRSHLLPAFARRDFHVVPLTGEDALSQEIRSVFPLGRLRREGPNGFEIVEIQLDKHGRPAFRLNIGIAPLGGIAHMVGRVAQDDVWVHYLEQYYEAYSWPFARRWFSGDSWLRTLKSQTDFDVLVSGAAEVVPEIEDVLSSGKLGRHIRRVGT